MEGGAPHRSINCFDRPRNTRLIFSLLLVAAVLVVYSPIVHNGFLNYDDDTYITSNPHVRAGLTWANGQMGIYHL